MTATEEGSPMLMSHTDLDGVHVVSLAGELDCFVAPTLESTVADALTATEGDLVFDLTEATFVDSTVLALMLRAQRQLRRRGNDVLLVSSDRCFAKVLAVTGLADRLTTFPSLEDALEVATPADGSRLVANGLS